MDALVASAHVWVPWLGVACLFLGEAWLRALGALPDEGDRPSALSAYFACLGLAIVLPVAASLAGWVLYGGIATLGPVVLLFEPQTVADQLHVGAWLLLPVLVFLIAQFLSASANGVAYAVAVAAAITVHKHFDPPVILAIALAAGGGASYAAQTLRSVAAGVGACAAFLFAFAFAYAGGGDVVALLGLAVIGGYLFSLIAANGARARSGLFLVLSALPVLALAWLDNGTAAFDLTTALPEPAVGSQGTLLMMLCLLPAIAAPFAWLPVAVTRLAARAMGTVGEGVAPAIALLLGLALIPAAAMALAAAASLYSGLHELSGAGPLLRVQTLIQQIRPAPFDHSVWWASALLLLPILPSIALLVALAVRVFDRLLEIGALKVWLAGAIERAGRADRFALTLTKRLVQIAPAILLLVLVLQTLPLASEKLGGSPGAVVSAISHGSEQAAAAVAALLD